MVVVLWVFGVLGVMEANAQLIPQNRTMTTDSQKPGLHDRLLETFQHTANYFGFGKKCRNKGVLTEDNECLCPRYFEGSECGTKICINGGVLEKSGGTYICKCPLHIDGTHCESPSCQNGGILIGVKGKSWKCDCSKLYFYKGTFCEVLNTPSLPVSVGGFVFLVFCLFLICHMNCCKRSRTRRCTLENDRRREFPRRARQTDVFSDDGLLTTTRIRRTEPYPEGVVSSNVVRLDTIPTFNPLMIGGVEPIGGSQQQPTQQPVGPPPSYDQIASIPHCQPPEYTPNDTNKL